MQMYEASCLRPMLRNLVWDSAKKFPAKRQQYQLLSSSGCQLQVKLGRTQAGW